MKNKIALLAFLVFFLLPSRTFGQSSPDYAPTMINFNDITQFKAETERWDSVQPYEFLGEDLTIYWRRFLSDQRQTLVYWDETKPLRDGLWFLDLPSLTLYDEIAIDGDKIFSYLWVEWIYGERFAIVHAGIYEDVEFLAHPQPRVTRAWLIDFQSQTATAWYWDCRQLLLLTETNSFAVACNLADYAAKQGQAKSVILTATGLITDNFPPYSIIHSLTEDEFRARWQFSPDGSKVVFSEETGFGYSHGRIYDLASHTVQAFAPTSWQYLLYNYWSMSGDYLVVGTSYQVTEVWRPEDRHLVWEAASLLGANEHLVISDFAWKTSEDGFYFLTDTQIDGHFRYRLYDFSIVDGEAVLNQQSSAPATALWVVDIPVQPLGSTD